MCVFDRSIINATAEIMAINGYRFIGQTENGKGDWRGPVNAAISAKDPRHCETIIADFGYRPILLSVNIENDQHRCAHMGSVYSDD